MLNNISIKTKLISLSIIVSLSFLLILIIELTSINKIDRISIISNNIGDMEIQLLELRKNEKDFLARKDLKYLDNYEIGLALNILEKFFHWFSHLNNLCQLFHCILPISSSIKL